MGSISIQDYRINERKSADRTQYSLKHLDREFKGEKVVKITTPRVKAYTVKRLDQGAANATVNRELAALKRMLNLGYQQTPPKVAMIPHIPMLKERNVRKGFFEHGDFLALLAELPPHHRSMVTFAYKSGWRKSEILTLTWSQVDRDQWIVRLEPGESKNEEARTMYLEDDLIEIFERQWAERKRAKIICPYVFTNAKGTDRVKDFYKVWRGACEKAGIGNRNFHDFRRTAIRDMVRAGVPERVAMMVSGHKTRAVFDRYNIVNDSDLRQAARKMAEYRKNSLGTISGTIRHFDAKGANHSHG